MANGDYMTREAARKALMEHFANDAKALISLLAEVVKTMPRTPEAVQAALLIDDVMWFTE